MAPPPAPAAAPADAAALTAHSEALRQHTAALNAWTTAATRLAAALEAAPTTDAPRQLLEDVRRALAALPRGASPGPPAAALLLDPVPLCPEALVRLRAAMDNALAGTSRPQASAILQAAGASGGNAWAKLRALIAVYHGGAGARVLDGDTSLMAERATSAQLAQDWRASGPSQLPTMRLRTGLEAATLLSHVARRMCTDADLEACVRRCSAPPSGRALVEKQPMGVYCASRNAFREARVGGCAGRRGTRRVGTTIWWRRSRHHKEASGNVCCKGLSHR